jgi:signal transduction histidine kinase
MHNELYWYLYRNDNRDFESERSSRSNRGMFEISNITRSDTFGFSNTNFFHQRYDPYGRVKRAWQALFNLIGQVASRRPWPLAARVPVVSGALILVVAITISHVMMSTVAREQELAVRRIAAVYLDGISTTIYPHVLARNLANTTEALSRTMWFHQSMRERRAMVRLPDGRLFADVIGPNSPVGEEDPIHDPGLMGQLESGQGFVFDTDTGTGWASRTIVRDGNHVADLYVALELGTLIQERRVLRRQLILAAVLAGMGAAAIGFLIVRRMVSPVRLLTERLRRAQAGDLDLVSADNLPPASTEFGRLLRGYNDLVDAFREREALAASLAVREREGVLGRLAATVAHEVRNPLGGMSTALDTVRKFGDAPVVRAKSLDLIERGLCSIRAVVDSVLAFHRMPPDSRGLTPGDLEDLRILIEPELARHQLTLTWNSSINQTIDVPATEIRQIAINLLLNACDASSAGGEVIFRAWLNQDDRPRLGEFSLEIADHGPGLPPDVAAALTEIGTSNSRDPSRGLGIRVVRDLVRGLGGRIVAANGHDGHGSRITVTLPTGGVVTRENTA